MPAKLSQIMDIHFTKMHGLGNDFIVLNNLDNEYSLSTEQISLLGNRQLRHWFRSITGN